MDNPDTANSYLLSPKAFQARLACDKTAYLIDVRTPKEFADGHIRGATLIDWLDNKHFMTKASTLDKSRPIYIYCRSGARSAEASEYLRGLGYTVYDMAGGILNWISQGLPIEIKNMNYIFDFDGTLMDTSGIILATIKATIKDMNLPAKTDDECRSIIGIRTDEAGKYLYPDLDISNAEFARVFRNNYDRLKDEFNAKPFPGVMETLEKIRKKGDLMAIASSRRLSSLNEYISELGIKDWFDLIIGADSVTKGKPDPEPVLKILVTLGWSPESTLVVGDADVDIMMGNAAGCRTVAVTYGNGSLASLKAAKPDYIVDSISELLP